VARRRRQHHHPATFFVKAGGDLVDLESVLEQFGYSASAAANAARSALVAYIF
jgi:hypothetical protein